MSAEPCAHSRDTTHRRPLAKCTFNIVALESAVCVGSCNSMSPQPTTTQDVDLTVGIKKPLPPEILATLSPVQRKMRSLFGAIVFILIAFTIGSIPVIGVPPVLYFLQWTGLAPHLPFRRFFDLSTANWMAFMTVGMVQICVIRMNRVLVVIA